jgi:hypothetical protein
MPVFAIYALDSPEAALREAVAQIQFYSGIGCLPATVTLSVLGFLLKHRLKSWACFVLAGLLFTHFLWYFTHLGIALSDILGQAHYPSWFHFAPIGVGLIYILVLIRESMQRRLRLKT